MSEVYFNLTFKTVNPGCCNQVFAVPKAQVQRWRRDHSTWYCPGCGKPRIFNGESDLEKAERLRKQAEESKARAWSEVSRQQDRVERERRSHAATRGHLTRKKKRAAAGVCPCCNRTFKQLAQHMSRKHPDYAEERSK